MNAKISKLGLLKKTILSFEVIFFIFFTIGFSFFIYFKNSNGNAKDIGSIILLFSCMLFLWIVVLYFYSLSSLKKIVSIIQNEGFTISDSILNPSKIEFSKNQKQFVLKVDSFSFRGTSLSVEPKNYETISEKNKNSNQKKELYTRYQSINELKSILESMTS